MQDMFEQHFASQELPSELIVLIEMTETLQAHSRNYKAMALSILPISVSLYSELISMSTDIDNVIYLFHNLIYAKLEEYKRHASK